MKIIFLTLCLATFLVPVYGEVPEPTVRRLLTRIRTELPKGWEATYDKDDAWLQVKREKPLFVFSAQPNSSPFEAAKSRQFTFAFRIVPHVSLQEYRRLSDENARIGLEIDTVHAELVRRKIGRKFDDFLPRTPEDKILVARYELLRKSRHSLPDFYFGDVSLKWGFNGPDSPIFSVRDERQSNECNLVQNRVVSLLTNYEKR